MNRFWFDDGDDDAAAVVSLLKLPQSTCVFLARVRWDLITASLICFVIAYLNTCLLALAHAQTHLLQIFSFSFLAQPVNSERSMQLFYGNSRDNDCYWICE